MTLEGTVKIGEVFEVKSGELTSHTKLQELLGDGRFIAPPPTLKDIPIWEDRDEPLLFCFFRHNGMYQFEADVVDMFRRDGLRLCEFLVVSDIRKRQRREFFRLPVVLDMMVSEIMPGEEGVRKTRKTPGKTVDLSEKSVKFSSFTKYPVGTKLIIDIQMTEMKTMTLKAKVYKAIDPLMSTDPYDLVLLFEELTKYQQTYISRFVIRKQIEARRIKGRRKND